MAFISSIAVHAAPDGVQAKEPPWSPWSLGLSQRLRLQAIPEDVLFSHVRAANVVRPTVETLAAYDVHLLGDLELRPTDSILLGIGLDSGLVSASKAGLTLDGRSLGQAIGETLLLGETFMDAEIGETGVLAVRAGKLRPSLGDGAIFGAYGLGLMADLDLSLLDPSLPLSLRVESYLVDATFTSRLKRSPLVHAGIGVQLARDTELRVLGAMFVDNDNALGQLLSEATARGRLLALGGSLDEIAADAAQVVGQDLESDLRMALDDYLDAATSAYNEGLIGFDVKSSGMLGWTGLRLLTRPVDFLDIAVIALVGVGRASLDVSPNDAQRGFVQEAVRENILPRITAAIRALRPNLTSLQVDRLAAATVGLLAQRIVAQSSVLADGASRLRFLSYFGKADVRVRILDPLAVSVFGLAASGDRGILTEPGQTIETSPPYAGFISVSPFLPYTSIFFNGGVATNSASLTLVTIAPDGAGVLALGARLEWRASALLDVRTVWAVMRAVEPSPYTGRVNFGTEANLDLAWTGFDKVTPRLSGAVFFPGAYYGQASVAYQVIGAVDVDLP